MWRDPTPWFPPIPGLVLLLSVGRSVGQLASYFFIDVGKEEVCGLSVGLGSGMAAALAAYISVREIARLARGSSWR